jgi:hypothetical protein
MGRIRDTATAPEPQPPENRQAAEIQRILRQNDRIFRVFTSCCLLACTLILLAMFLKWGR